MTSDHEIAGRTGRVVVTFTGQHHVLCFKPHLDDRTDADVIGWIAEGARQGVDVRSMLDHMLSNGTNKFVGVESNSGVLCCTSCFDSVVGALFLRLSFLFCLTITPLHSFL